MFEQLYPSNFKDDWKLLGPGGGGCVHTLTINPHQPGTMVVSCDMTAGYITHDGGGSWREFNLKSRQYAYAFDPLNSDRLYVGTSGLFRSEDNGNNWTMLFPDPGKVTGETRLGDEANHNFLASDNWPGGSIHAILVDPRNSKHLFIAIKKEGWQIFASQDEGGVWIKLAHLPGEDFHLLAFDTASPVGQRTLLAFTSAGGFRLPAEGGSKNMDLPASVLSLRHASCGKDPENGQTLLALSALEKNAPGMVGSSIWVSSDLGLSWQPSATGLEACCPEQPPLFSQVSICPADARVMWLIAEKFPELDGGGKRIDRHGILKSTDRGRHWNWAVKMDDDQDPPNRRGGWAERDYGSQWGDLKGDDQISPKGRFAWDVVPSPVDPKTCYTMDFSTIFKTGDGGTSWEQLVTHIHPDGSASSRGIDVLNAYSVVFDPYDPNHIVLPLTDLGMFHSMNGGLSWQHALQGVPRRWINSCYWMIFDPDVRGRAWSAWSAMHDIPRSKMFQPEQFIKPEGGICKTEDNLQSWQASNGGMPAHSLCTHILLDPRSPAGRRTLYAAVFNSGVYKSIDDGRTWILNNKGLDLHNRFAWRMALLPSGTLYLVVVKNQLPGQEFSGAVYKSMDGAESWKKVPLPAGVDFPNDLTFDPAGRLYLSCWPRTQDGKNTGGGVYSSDNGGQTWEPIFDPGVHVYSLTVDKEDLSVLYIATFHGSVLKSKDRGKIWRRLKGCDFQWNERVIPDPYHPGMVYLTTFGSSVWYGPAEYEEAA
jgi:hypothetical protein